MQRILSNSVNAGKHYFGRKLRSRSGATRAIDRKWSSWWKRHTSLVIAAAATTRSTVSTRNPFFRRCTLDWVYTRLSVRGGMNGYYSREQFTNRRLEPARLESAFGEMEKAARSET